MYAYKIISAHGIAGLVNIGQQMSYHIHYFYIYISVFFKQNVYLYDDGMDIYIYYNHYSLNL